METYPKKKTLDEFMNELAHGITPGGGSAAALAASMAAALGAMVVNLTLSKKGIEKKADRMRQTLTELDEFRNTLLNMVEEDSRGYQAVLKSSRLPKETEDQKKERHAAMQRGYRTAMETPLKVAKLCLKLLEVSSKLVKEGYSKAATDAGVMALLADAALQGSILNILVNLKGIDDPDTVAEYQLKAERMRRQGNSLKEMALSEVYSRI